MDNNKIFIKTNKNVERKRAEELSRNLNVKIIDEKDINEDMLILQLDENGLSLVGRGMTLYGDYSKMINRISRGRLQSEMLVKASKIKDKKENLIAIDATAGMGEDSLLLASAGFEVHLYEKNKIIAALLKDTIERAKEIEELKDAVDKMIVHEEDSIDEMKSLGLKSDIILLDPMFPERNKSALIKKKFQILQQLECPCVNEAELIESAKMAHPHKIIIKRPLKGKFLADIKPSYSLKGKAIRYDVIVMN